MGMTRRRSIVLIAIGVILGLLLVLPFAWRASEPTDEAPGEPRVPAADVMQETPTASLPSPSEKGGAEAAPRSAAAEDTETAASEPEGPKTTIEGRICFEDGAPVTDRPVWLWGGGTAEGKTDATGRYRLDGNWKSHQRLDLMVGPRNAAVRAGRVPVVTGEAVTFDATLTRGTAFDVIVTDRDRGDPLPELNVYLDADPWAPESDFAFGTTDEHGRIALRHVPRRTWRLRIHHEGYRPHREPLDLSVGDPAGPHRVVLERALSLTLRVVPPPAKKGTLVNLQLTGEGAVGGIPYVGNLDEAGTFTGDAPPPGRYHVWLLLGGMGNFELPPITVEPRQPVEIVAKLPSGGGVSGVLLDADGQPIGGAVLSFQSVTPRLALVAEPTDATGGFSLAFVVPDRYQVDVHLGGQSFRNAFPWVEVDESGVSDLRLQFRGRGRLVGRLVGAKRPETFVVRVSFRDGERWRDCASTTVGKDGTFEIRHLVPRRGLAQARQSRGERLKTEPVEVAIREGGAPARVELRVRSANPVVLQIATASGAPYVGSLQVMVIAQGSRPSLRVVPMTIGEDGRGEIPDLDPGRYLLTFRLPRGKKAPGQLEIEVKDGESEPIHVQLSE